MTSVWGELKRRNVVRIAIAYGIVSWLILQLSDVLVPLLSLPDWVGRFIFLFLVIGFVLALFLSWAYELTPDGVKREADVDRSISITTSTGRKLDFAIIGMLVIALGYFIWESRFDTRLPVASSVAENDRPELAAGTGVGRRTIAVLPFLNMSSDEEQEFFSDGLSEELLNLLARIPEMRVTSRTSAFSFKGKNTSIAEIGKMLDVDHILEGSVRRSGDTIRITAQLIEVDTDAHIWSETWDRTFGDVFSIQDEIATSVVGALRIKLLGEMPRVLETTPEAYSLYLQGRSLAFRREADLALQSEILLKRALDLDDRYAPGWVQLGQTYVIGANIGSWEPRYAFPLARDAAQNALRHDSQNAEAHVLLSRIARDYDYDMELARAELDLVSELAPDNIEIRLDAAILAYSSGVKVDTTTFWQEAVLGDPLNLQLKIFFGIALFNRGQLDEAIAVLRDAIALNPNVAGAHARLARALLMRGEFDAALEAADKEVRDGHRVAARALVFQAVGETGRAKTELDALIAIGYTWTYEIAEIYAFRGEVDDAFIWLDRAIERRDTGLGNILVDPFLENIRDDARYLQVLERIGRKPTD